MEENSQDFKINRPRSGQDNDGQKFGIEPREGERQPDKRNGTVQEGIETERQTD